MMLANLNGPAPDCALEFIAETAALLLSEEEDVEVISRLAASLLKMDYNAFQNINPKKSYCGLGYLVPWEWLEKSRIHCGYYNEIEWGVEKGRILPSIPILDQIVVPDGAYAANKETLVKCEVKPMFKRLEHKPIVASGDGIVHYVAGEGHITDVWITSAFDTWIDFPVLSHKELEIASKLLELL